MPKSSAVPAPDGSAGAGATWQECLLAELHALGADIGGRVIVRSPSISGHMVAAVRFSDPDYLLEAIIDCGRARFGSTQDVVDDDRSDIGLAVAASRFTRHYVSSLTAAAMVGLVHGVGLDLSARRCVKVLRGTLPRQHLMAESDEGVVACEERPTGWPVRVATVVTVEELRRHVWTRLYAEHLAPLITMITELTGAAPRLLWSGAAEWLAHTVDMADEHLGSVESTLYFEEADALLNADALAGLEGPNPLHGLVEWVQADAPDLPPRGVLTRRHCCITFLLPDRLGRLCRSCPFLPLPDRLALVRELQASHGGRGGPAEKRATEIGLRKVRTNR